MKGHCHAAKQPLNSSKYEGQNHTRIHKVTLESLEDRFTILWNFVSWFPSGIFIDFWGQKGSPCLFTAWLKVLIFQWLSGDSTDSTSQVTPQFAAAQASGWRFEGAGERRIRMALGRGWMDLRKSWAPWTLRQALHSLLGAIADPQGWSAQATFMGNHGESNQPFFWVRELSWVIHVYPRHRFVMSCW